MRQKSVSKRLNSLREARSAVRTHREWVSGLLDQRPAARNLATPEGGAFRSRPHFDLMDEELAVLEDRIVTADDAHTHNRVRIVELRRKSEELTTDVYDKQVSARRLLAGAYGADRNYELAAMEGKTPQFSEALAHQVDQTVKLLSEPAAATPPQRLRGVRLDLEEIAGDLQESLEDLLDTRTLLENTQKAIDASRIDLNRAKKEFDKTFPWVGRNLESLFRLAGEDELADRIRAAVRRITSHRPEKSPSAEALAEESLSEEAVSESDAERTDP